MARQTADLNSVLPKKPSVSGRLPCASCSPGTTRLIASRSLNSLSRAHSAWRPRRIATTITKSDLWHRRSADLDFDGKQIDVGPGQALCIPRAAVHRFDNNGSRDVKALCVITPAAIGPQYFRDSAEVINAAAGGPPDRTKMADIMRRHGLTPAPSSAQA